MKKKVLKVILKSTLWFLFGIIALLLIVLLAIQTPFVKRQIVSIAETQAGKLLNAEVSVGRLTGNFFTRLALEDIALRSPEGDTIASIARVKLAYDWSYLLQKTIWVDSIIIDRPYVHVYQLPDSTWNLAHLLRPTDTPEDTTASAPFDMTVWLHRLSLQNARARIDAFGPNIPRRVDSLSFNFRGNYYSRTLTANLHDLRFTAAQPGLRLKPSQVFVQATPAEIKQVYIRLLTEQNDVTLFGNYDFARKNLSHIKLDVDTIRFDELGPWLPEGFPMHTQPRLLLEILQKEDSLNAELLVDDGPQILLFEAAAGGIFAWLTDSTAPPVIYNAELILHKIDPGYWLADPDMDYLINSRLKVKGRGLDPHTLRADLKGSLNQLIVQGRPIDQVSFDLAYNAGDLSGSLNGEGDFGSLSLIPQVEQLLGDRPRYQVGLTTRRLDASALLGDTAYRTNLNLTADLTGSGFDPDRLTARVRLRLQPSSALHMTIDTLDTDLTWADSNLQIQHLLLEALHTRLHVNGNYSLTGDSELWLEAHVDSMRQINQLTGMEGAEAQARINAHAQGRPEALRADLQAAVLNARYDALSVDSLHLAANAALTGKDLQADARLEAYRPAMDSLRLNSVELQVATDTRNYRMTLAADGEDMNARLNAFVQLGDAIQVALSDLALGYRDYQWQQVSDTAWARIADTEYELRDFHLATAGDTLPSSLYVDGLVSRTDSQQLQIDAERLNIGRLLHLLDMPLPADGLASLHLRLTGEAASPRLTGLLTIDSSSVDKLRFDTVQSNIRLADRRLTADLTVVPRELGRIYVEGALPAHVRLDSMTFEVVPADDDSISARLLVHKIPLSILRSFVDVDEAAGELNSRIEVGGVMSQPQVAGTLQLDSGAVKIVPYGIDYRNMQADIRIAEDQVRIDTFLIESSDGTMTARGGVQFRSELYNADLDSSRLDIAFNRFNPFNHKQFRMEMSGDVGVQANADSTTFSGDISIPEANIYLPAIMALMGRFSTPNMPQPLLVAELEKLTQPGDSLVYTFRPDTTAADTAARGKLAFLDNLQGEIKVSIPRNTWIRNEDMRLELSGDVRLMKHRDFFELFGTIDVVRGQYNLLGKVFVIQTGTVTFQGGEQINPILNIDAIYSFRDPYRNKRDLGITVSGDLENLTIKFNLEGEEIGEGDALSYIIFGRALNELSASEASGMDPGKLAGMAAASLISSQLTKLGNTFNVDYIEVDVGSSFDNASLTVGKYITNKLFISYEQRIGTLEDKDTARYEMTLEYELFKFLFLQLTSSPITNGFDLIFKVNSK